jgi:hypothetical protein
VLSIQITEVNVIVKARNLATTTIASILAIYLVGTFGGVGYGNLTDDATVAEKYINMEEAPSTSEPTVIAQVVDVKITDDQTIRVGLTEDYLSVNYTSLETDAELSVMENTNDDDIDIRSIVDKLEEAEEAIKKEQEEAEIAAAQAELAKRGYSLSRTQGGLIDIINPDPNYTGKAIRVTGNDRSILEHLVMGEAGNQGFEGAALVAQAIRDMYVLGGYSSVESVRRNCGYAGSLKNTPNQDVLDAVSFIFDQGGYAVKHRVLYFYAYKTSSSKFHESQNLVVQYKDHRFFDRWY